jgi:hypothetical protein
MLGYQADQLKGVNPGSRIRYNREKNCNGTKVLIRYRRFYVTSRYVVSDIFSNEIYRQFAGTKEWLLYIQIYVITRYVIKEVYCTYENGSPYWSSTLSPEAMILTNLNLYCVRRLVNSV